MELLVSNPTDSMDVINVPSTEDPNVLRVLPFMSEESHSAGQDGEPWRGTHAAFG